MPNRLRSLLDRVLRSNEMGSAAVPAIKCLVSEELEGHIETHEELQNQNFADVLRATWTRPDGKKLAVVVKCWPFRPKPDQAGNKGAVEDASTNRMVREAIRWLSLSHKHILPLYGWKEEGPKQGYPCIVMPYMQKGDLASYIKRPEPATSNMERLKLLCQVANALVYLHKERVVHGDLKAQNVLIGDDNNALLCDFGAARVADAGKSGLTTGSQNAGTEGYKAPERYEDNYKPDEASDVYSFGGLIVEVLSGIPPWRGKSRNGTIIATKVALEKLTTPPEEHPRIPVNASIWELARHCWAYDLKARPSMADVLATLTEEYRFVEKNRKHDALKLIAPGKAERRCFGLL